MSLSHFEILEKIGEGAFSSVYKVKRKSDNCVYALKKVKFATLTQKEKFNSLNEIRILASISHPNVIEYKEAFFEEQILCIVMEFANSGDLLSQINSHRRCSTHFPENEIWSMLIQLTRGLKSLHSLSILHRDLKSANIFIHNGVAKIGDLNVSKVLKQGLANTQIGTPVYASPEIWRDQPYNSSSDIWSLGCLIYEMAALSPPFHGTDMIGLYRRIVKGHFSDIPSYYSDELNYVIRAMIQVNPGVRPTCVRILEIPAVSRRLDWEDTDVKDELLQTIKFNPSLKILTNRLPAAKYVKKGRGLSAKIETVGFGKENCEELANEKLSVNKRVFR